MFHYAELPVFGQMGPKTKMDSTVHPPVVQTLHCLLDMVPESEIWRIFPCVILDAELANRFRISFCSGFELRSAIFEAGDAFQHFHGKAMPLPKLHWCHITGTAYMDDLGFADKSKLIVSEKVKGLIEAGKHDGVSFLAGDRPPTNEEIDARIWADATKVAQDLKARGKPCTGWFAPPQS